MSRTEGPLFEFACHEGNERIMVMMLTAARVEELKEKLPTIEVHSLDFVDAGAPVPLQADAAARGDASVERVEFLVDGAVVGVDREAPYQVMWIARGTGRYVVTSTVHDSEGRVGTSVPVAGFVGLRALERSIAGSADDAEERPDGRVNVTSSDLELVNDDGRDQVVGLRFTDIGVPQGAKVKSAHVQFTVDEDRVSAAEELAAGELIIHGELAADSERFGTAAHDVSARPQTAASEHWSPGPWTVVGERGEQQRTPDLSAVIEEVVALPGWRAGNALALIIRGSGHREADSYDGNTTGAPILYIELDH